MKLNRKQKNYLINLGLQQVLDNLTKSAHKKFVIKKTRNRKWSKARREKFAATMARRFARKNE